MTITPPIGNPVTLSGLQVRYQPYTDVTSFTERTAATFQGTLEALSHYVSDTLTPHINDQFNALYDVLDGESDTLTQVQDLLAEVFASANLLGGPGIDPTGVTPSTAAVQALLDAQPDGSTLSVPSGAIINLDGNIHLSKRITLTGPGELRWTDGIQNKEALSVYAEGCVLFGLRLVNATGTAAPTGDKQAGIAISTHNVSVMSCRLDGFQQAICVQPFGEFYGNRIIGNAVLNVPGSGGGRGSPSPAGEDRGDGIVSWGAETVIIGNRVQAKPGDDCRIGIHTEGIPSFEGSPGEHSSSLCTINANVVTGKFRRGIACEGVEGTTITGNSVADATWWGIALTGADGSLCTGNAILWTSTVDDNQGAAFSPHRSGIMVYGGGADTIIGQNVIKVAPGAVLPYGIHAETNNVGIRERLTIIGNTAVDPNNGMYAGIYCNGGAGIFTGLRVLNNHVEGFTNSGIYSWNSVDPEVCGNRLKGAPSKSADGIFIDGNPSGARADNNRVESVHGAVKVPNRTAATTANLNLIVNADLGIDYTGTPNPGMFGNTMVGVTTATKAA